MMNLTDALNSSRERNNEPNIFFVHGTLESDPSEGFFRIYTNPDNQRSFYRVREDTVVGEIYEWTAAELVQAGLVGVRVFRVGLRYGTEIQHVVIRFEKMGETIEATSSARMAKRGVNEGCRSADGCASFECCTGGDKCVCNNCCIAASGGSVLAR
jgi:hypothetical protein